MTIMIKPENLGLRRGAKAAGLEYAIRRTSDGAWLFDADWDGTDSAWEADPDNATWQGDLEDATRLASLNHLLAYDAAGDPQLMTGLEFVARPWFYEEDYLDSDEETPLDALDFSAIGVTTADFTD